MQKYSREQSVNKAQFPRKFVGTVELIPVIEKTQQILA